MPFDPQTILGLGVIAFVAILLHRRFRSRAAAAVVAEDEIAVGRRKDVLRAIKSMRKD